MTVALFPSLKNMIRNTLLAALLLVGGTLSAETTIGEKLAGAPSSHGELPPDLQDMLQKVNKELQILHGDLVRLYSQVEELYRQGAAPEAYASLLDQIHAVHEKIAQLEENWRRRATTVLGTAEPYALWHQPETTLGDIIIDYGSQSYVYLMPPSLSTLKLSLDSSIPIPRGSWDEMLELILTQNGIGVRQLNPFLRQLYSLREDNSPIALITNKREDLAILPPNTRICFVLTPPPSEVRRLWYFLDKFINNKTTVLQNIGREILVISQVSDIKELLKLYDFAIANQGDKQYKLVTLKRADTEEMARVLTLIFDQLRREAAPPPPMSKGEGRTNPFPPAPPSSEGSTLQIIPLKNIAPALFLIGTNDEIKRAMKIIQDVESQIGGSKEKVIFTYHVRHSSAEELAKILDKMYGLMLRSGARFFEERGPPPPPPGGPPLPPGAIPPDENNQNQQNRTLVQVAVPPPMPPPPPPLPADLVYGDTFYQRGGYVINPEPIQSLMPAPPRSREPDRNNFIVDPKTNIILMVVETDAVPRLKELLAKIDVPKQMVQIDVLLFEKRMNQATNFGLNLLRIGQREASNTQDTGATFNEPFGSGIFRFLISRMQTDNLPPFDAVYSFLISQEDIQLNVAPSALTLNQTPVLIAIQEEISINTGEFLVDTATGQPAMKNSYTRAQYGITIKVTPTIHMQDDDPISGKHSPDNYVTLESELTFDTFRPTRNDRPDVTRRKITSLVRILDGQSVILGGLRRKDSSDAEHAIPFFGELPGIGKLFSNTHLSDLTTEMFIVLTPRIVNDPLNDLECIKWQEMYRRPGDLPEFLAVLVEARDWEKRELLRGTMRILFGPDPDRPYYCDYGGEYDGRP